MRVIERRNAGEPLVLIRTVPTLPVNGAGYIEQWYCGGHDQFDGIKLDDIKKLEYAFFVSSAQGFQFSNRGFYGITCQDKLYDEVSCLVNGAILTYSTRREFVGRKESPLPKIRVSEILPERILGIMGETRE